MLGCFFTGVTFVSPLSTSHPSHKCWVMGFHEILYCSDYADSSGLSLKILQYDCPLHYGWLLTSRYREIVFCCFKVLITF